MTTRRGRPPTIRPEIIQSIRVALAAGLSIGTIARGHAVSRRYVADLAADAGRRTDATPLPPEIAAMTGQEGQAIQDFWREVVGPINSKLG
jgi:hypothetical protein